jgi:hypothetical protein
VKKITGRHDIGKITPRSLWEDQAANGKLPLYLLLPQPSQVVKKMA